MAVTFIVTPASRRKYARPDHPALFALQRDTWDDFGFKTQYHLAYNRAKDEGLIGAVSILKRGQEPSASALLPEGELGPLSEDYCSLGQSLDYYERIAELPEDVRASLLLALRDAVAFPEHAAPFRQETGWATSILRGISDEAEFIQVASVLLTRDYRSLPALTQDLRFSVAGWSRPLDLKFAAPLEDQDTSRRPGGARNRFRLPQRITVLTGRNGSGKSTLLARLARVLHASQADRASPAFKSLGLLEPESIGFTRIITVSYSAFDAFQVPGRSADERLQIARDLKAGTGRYFFCGLRDIARELIEEAEKSDVTILDTPENAPLEADRQADTFLKPLTDLAEEFARTVERIFASGRADLFEAAAALLLTDPSFSHVSNGSLAKLLHPSPREAFDDWSTGHKIVLHILASLVAHTEPKSIILFDEPESHLHPPLLAALMHCIRYLLEERDAFAVVATHSPVVAQETLARHVNIVRRVEHGTTLLEASIETFGEGIAEITDEVFGLNAEVTDYHEILRGLFERLGSIEAVEAVFDRGLSLQARAYLMTLRAASKPAA